MTAFTARSPSTGDVEMFSRGRMQPVFPVETTMAGRASMLSMVPEVESPSRYLSVPDYDSRIPKARPISEVTEIFDEDDEDESSNFEEDSDESYSYESNQGRHSQSTISTIDEIPTPHSSRQLSFTRADGRRSVEGPRGPHLFRSSTASEFSFDFALQLSPLVPKRRELRIDTSFNNHIVEPTPTTIADAPAAFAASEDEWNKNEPSTWTTNQVSLWLYQTGADSAVIEKFEDNDISGKILIDLLFQDLKDIGIESFGKRHEIWDKICSLRGGNNGISPVPTPFQDVSPRRTSRESIRMQEQACDETYTPITPGAGRRRRRRYRTNPNDPITPMDSVSIVAIEQLLPKQHRCARGEDCSKWKKQQKLMKRLQQEHGFPISPENGGHIFMAGNPGNAVTAPNIVHNAIRPTSDANPSIVGPSVVASSDLLGPGDMPTIALQADLLQCVGERDAQENVKNFLSFQHTETPQPIEPTSPLGHHHNDEMLGRFPPVPSSINPPSPLNGLQSLPRLQIPRTNPGIPCYDSHGISAIQDPFSACRTAVASPVGIYRFGTPASEMDMAVPVTAIPSGPVARDTSQSVPPNMLYRNPPTRDSTRQDWRKPSFALPRVNENEVFASAAMARAKPRRGSDQTFGSSDLTALKEQVDIAAAEVHELPTDPRYPGVNHTGWMKKRKTRMLRHEWNEHHFRLNGNQLAMHQNDIPQSAVLEALNIDEYAIACGNIASNKLAARLKALKITNARDKDALKDSAFEFQLVPDQVAKHSKSHHFAVKSRDERIDWMRELMLAKALRAKREGFDVEVNGKEV